LTVFSHCPAYRKDLTLPAARHLLYALHEGRKLSDVITLAALFPAVRRLPPLSSDIISSALLLSACLREVHASGCEHALTVAVTLLSPFKQLLAQSLPMPISIEKNRFQEHCWMKHAMLSMLDSLTMQGQGQG
jgi:hypothetical protein